MSSAFRHTREKTQCEWEWTFFEQKSTRRKWHRNLLLLLLWDVVPKRQRHFAHIHKHIQHSLLLTLTHWQQNNKRKLSISVFTDSISFYMDSLLWKIIWNRKWMALPFLGVLFLSQSHPLPLAHIALCLHSFDYFYLGFVISNAIVPKQFKLNRQPYSNKTNWQRTTHERPIEHTKKKTSKLLD